MKRNNYDANMYYMHQDGEELILILYIDDLFITCNRISWFLDSNLSCIIPLTWLILKINNNILA